MANGAEWYAPTDINLFGEEDISKQFARLYVQIQKVGTLTKRYWDKCIEEDTEFGAKIEENPNFMGSPTTFVAHQRERALLNDVFTAWRVAFVSQIETMREIRSYDGGIRNTIGMSIFFELSRLYGLIHRPSLLEEWDVMSTLDDDEISKEKYAMFYALSHTHMAFDVDAASDDDEKVNTIRDRLKTMWPTPIMQYTCAEARLLVLFLTQQLNDVTLANMAEFRHTFHILWLRVSAIFSEQQPTHVMDDVHIDDDEDDDGEGDAAVAAAVSENAAFGRRLGYFSFYMGEIMRRLFYVDMLAKNRMDMNLSRTLLKKFTDSCQSWVTKIVDGFAEEAFEDMYANVARGEGYNFPGDDSWFTMRWPTRVYSRGACITVIRPHLYKRYYSEDQLTRKIVMSTAKTRYVSRLFVFRAIDEYMRMHMPRVQWQNAVVVSSNGIEMSAYHLQTSLAPMLLQVAGGFWAYDRGMLHACDDIFESIAVWFWLLHTRYADTMFDCPLTPFVKEALKL